MERGPQWKPQSDDRPEWTGAGGWVPRQSTDSWFDRSPVGGATRWDGAADAPVTPASAGPPTQAWSAPAAEAATWSGTAPETSAWPGPVAGNADRSGTAPETSAWPGLAAGNADRSGPPAEIPVWPGTGVPAQSGPARPDRAARFDPESTGAWAPLAGGFRPAVGRADDAPATDTFPAVPDQPTHHAWTSSGWGGESWAGPATGSAAAPAAEPVPVGATRWEPPAAGRTRSVRHPIRIALFTLVLFGLVGGSLAWMSMDKNVRLTVDGEARTVSTYASTVGGVLDDAEVTVGEHDTLAPGRDAKISDGAEIVLRRGRLVTLVMDGKPKKVWVTATTVQEALDQVGIRQTGLFVSANRSQRLPLEGYQLTLRTPKSVTFVADGKKHQVTTTAPTVGEAMEAAGVTVDGDDKVSQLASAPVRAGMTVTITRVSTKTVTTRTVVEYKTVETADPKAEVGSRTVKTKGANGLQEVTRVQTYVDGRLTSSKVAKVTVLTEPVDEVVVVGPEPPEPAPTQPAECADFPTTGGLSWCGLAKCESGLNPNAYNPAGPYYGLYQFDQGTWTSNGGSGSPSGKSVAEQTAVAWNLYQARGASPWPVCGRNL